MVNKIFVCVLAALCLPCVMRGEDDGDSYTRENPDIDVTSSYDRYSDYPYLNLAANCIVLNGEDTVGLKNAIRAVSDRTVSIVHIGDSHIQADMGSGQTRRLVQERYGSAGRGLIAPLKIAGTNQPVDYTFNSSSQFNAERLLADPWTQPMGLSGVSLKLLDSSATFTICCDEPFERVRLYYSGSLLSVDNVTDMTDGSVPLVFATDASAEYVEIYLPMPCSSVEIKVSTFGETCVHGAMLSSDLIGVYYHAIGINGATFDNYNRFGSYGSEVASLSPDIIIISLGTNEAFGRTTDYEFRSSIDRLVNSLRRANPDAFILLTTPSECQRSYRRRRGRRSYAVNKRVAELRDIIVDYGRRNGVAVYDWYEVAGGAGASAKMLADKLLNTDRIHMTRAGYELAGSLLFDALVGLVGEEDDNND